MPGPVIYCCYLGPSPPFLWKPSYRKRGYRWFWRVRVYDRNCYLLVHKQKWDEGKRRLEFKVEATSVGLLLAIMSMVLNCYWSRTNHRMSYKDACTWLRETWVMYCTCIPRGLSFCTRRLAVRLLDLQLQGCGFKSPKLTTDFIMTKVLSSWY